MTAAAIELENQGAKRPRARPPCLHQDQLNQPITPGVIVAFTYAYSCEVRLGTVVKLTPHRVRIRYNHQWWDLQGQGHYIVWEYLAKPRNLLVITDTVQQELTLAKLKGIIP